MPDSKTFAIRRTEPGDYVAVSRIFAGPKAVRDDWQGQGVGQALMQAAIDLADNWLNLSRLELEVYTDNEPALRLYTKWGFTIEGTLVQYAYRDGRYVDTYQMARLRPSRA
jgi:L-phenylalanine/L-methionine N-acetyltransferase